MNMNIGRAVIHTRWCTPPSPFESFKRDAGGSGAQSGKARRLVEQALVEILL